MSKELNFLKPFEKDILGRESYEYFKKNKRFNSKQTDDYYKWKRILTSFIIYFRDILIFSNKGFYIKGIGYFYFEPIKYSYKKVLKFKKVKDGVIHTLKFIPDLENLSDWQPDNFKIKSEDIKICDLDTLEFLKSQTVNGIHINRRAHSRGRK